MISLSTSATSLQSFGAQLNVAVIGAAGGIGGAIHADLNANKAVHNLFGLVRSPGTTENWLALDIEDESSIAAAAKRIGDKVPALDLIIVATGILHEEALSVRPEKTWRHLTPDAMETVFRINTIGPSLVAKHFLPLLNKTHKSAFAAISARVGSVSDNRIGGWYAYRASKAALNQILKSASIELKRSNDKAICVGLHPGTVDTGLSKPFQSGVAAGKLFSPAQSAHYMLRVLDDLTVADTGGLYAWDGQSIPF